MLLSTGWDGTNEKDMKHIWNFDWIGLLFIRQLGKFELEIAIQR